MDDECMRLEVLRLAHQAGGTTREIVLVAQRYYEFLCGRTPGVGAGPSTKHGGGVEGHARSVAGS